MKQRIKLTESQLHNIIRKCVNEALSEGQGWNSFKSIGKRIMNGDEDERINSGYFNTKKWKDDANDYINPDENDKYYDEEGTFLRNKRNEKSKSVNKGISGKIGRWAAAKGLEGLGRAKGVYNKLKD